MQAVAAAPDGTDIYHLPLRCDGLAADILSFGAVVQDLRLDGVAGSLVLGYPDPADYLRNPNYFGATVGRYANRICQGRAVIHGTPVHLDQNTEQGHLLHGGHQGTSHLNWQVVAQSQSQSQASATLAITLPDGHMGFPGELRARVTYRILPAQQLEIEITATTDRPTLCSFAHHGYFNFGPHGSIADHRLTVQADHYLPTDQSGIPLGHRAAVDGSLFDLRAPRVLDDVVLDHTYCLPQPDPGVKPVARLAGNGLVMELSTDAPGLQVYTGDGIAPLHDPPEVGPRAGIALEPQIWPDAPNHKGFPNPVLLPTQTYRQRTRLRFKRHL